MVAALFILGADAHDVYATKWALFSFSEHLFTESNGVLSRDSSYV